MGAMTTAERHKLWRSLIMMKAFNGWLPSWQEHGGKCMTRYIIGGPVTGTWHRDDGMGGAFLCKVCGRVIIRGEGRWWE